MKKIQLQHFLIVLAVITSAFIISCNDDEEKTVLDFDFTVPENWSSDVYANEGFIYAAGRKPVDDNDTILEVIYIFKYSAPGSSLNLYYSNEIKPLIIGSSNFVSLLRETDTIINGMDFIKLVSKEVEIIENIAATTSDNDTLDLITERYIFYENNFGYDFVLVSIDTLYYQKNHELFDDIMGTFHYKE